MDRNLSLMSPNRVLSKVDKTPCGQLPIKINLPNKFKKKLAIQKGLQVETR